MSALLTPIPLLYRWLMLAAFAVALVGFGYVKGHEAGSAAGEKFEGATKALGDEQLAYVAKVNQKQIDTLNGAKHDLETLNKQVADNAVRNYVARHPVGVRNVDPGKGGVSGQASGDKGNDDAANQPVATCQPDAGFIKACAADAALVDVWQNWARNNELPIQ